MTVTLILRLDSDALREGELRGWAELVSRDDRTPIDGPASILDAARAATRSEVDPRARGAAAPAREGSR